MKCPKCGYLGFDHVDRCRNCGYDFSLASGITVPELPLRPEPPKTDRFADLSLAAPRTTDEDLDSDLDPILTTSSTGAEADRDLPRQLQETASSASVRAQTVPTVKREAAAAVSPTPAVAAPVRSPSNETVDDSLPLFGGPITDDVPLITKASPPRAPLAVRRATPEVPRVRAETPRPTSAELRLDLDIPEPDVRSVEPAVRANAAAWPGARSERDEDDAALGARFIAVAIDVAVLAIIDVIVVYFTMQICGLTLADLGTLPKVPLLAFLAVQNGGYLVAFTAGGQTLGKMATGIRVVTAGSGRSLDVGRATLRTLVWCALAVPAGLGFLSAVFSADRRGLHDRFAGSRVVRAA